MEIVLSHEFSSYGTTSTFYKSDNYDSNPIGRYADIYNLYIENILIDIYNKEFVAETHLSNMSTGYMLLSNSSSSYKAFITTGKCYTLKLHSHAPYRNSYIYDREKQCFFSIESDSINSTYGYYTLNNIII